jgi:uncharacterized protein (DUF983 family)
MDEVQTSAQQDPASALVDDRGRPARRTASSRCPRCGAGPEKRTASSGFGTPHPVCSCGFEWFDEVFRG